MSGHALSAAREALIAMIGDTSHIMSPHSPMTPVTTWAALLGRWMDLARASRALDGGDRGPLARALVPLITLEAMRCACGGLESLELSERALAFDQAAHVIEDQAAALDDAFEEWPPVATEAYEAATAAWAACRHDFVWTMCWEGPGLFTMPPVSGVPARRSTHGAVAVMLPGTLAAPGAPIAWWSGRDEPVLARGIAGCRALPRLTPLQVWRVFDAQGCAVEDLVNVVDADDVASAIPLLVPRLAGGRHLEPPTIDATYPPADITTVRGDMIPVRWEATQEPR